MLLDTKEGDRCIRVNHRVIALDMDLELMRRSGSLFEQTCLLEVKTITFLELDERLRISQVDINILCHHHMWLE